MEALAQQPPLLQGGGQLEVHLSDPRHARLRLIYGRTHTELKAGFLSVPYPSGLRRLLAREPDLEAVVVDRIPPGLIDAAQDQEVAVLDRAGYGRVVAPGFVYVAPPPARPAPISRSATSPFAPKASRIVRALLTQPTARWRLSSAVELVDVDPGNAHRIFASLIEIGLIERDEDEYVVSDPGSLLEAWAEFNRPSRERLMVPATDPLGAEIRALLAEHGEAIVVSGEFAAEQMTPYLPAQSALVHCIDPWAWDRLVDARREILPPRASPHGMLILDRADAGVAQFGEIVDGLPLVHPTQVYVDLFRARGRGREAAEHLRRERIAY